MRTILRCCNYMHVNEFTGQREQIVNNVSQREPALADREDK